MLGFLHEFDRPDYDGIPCGSSQPVQVGVSSSDPLSLMNYEDCGSINTLSWGDILGFAEVYGLTPVRYSSSAANHSQLLAIHDTDSSATGKFLNPVGGFSGFNADTTYVLLPEDPSWAGEAVWYGEVVRMLTKSGTYLSNFRVLGSMPAGSELMVRDTIMLSKVAGPANSTFPPYVRFVSLGAGILF